jgi:hypothetical protein
MTSESGQTDKRADSLAERPVLVTFGDENHRVFGNFWTTFVDYERLMPNKCDFCTSRGFMGWVPHLPPIAISEALAEMNAHIAAKRL